MALPLMVLLARAQEDLPVTVAFVLLRSRLLGAHLREARVAILLASAGISRASFASQQSCQ